LVVLLAATFAFSSVVGLNSVAQTTAPEVRMDTPSGRVVPRFESIKSSEARVRRGPGSEYVIDWVFIKKGLPIEVIGESGLWRQIRDHEGNTGWMHSVLLTKRRMVMITGGIRLIRDEAHVNAEAVAMAEPGVIAELESCSQDWCIVKSGKIKGWIRQEYLFGVYPTEFSSIDLPES